MSILIRGLEMPKEGTVIAIYKLDGKFFASVHGTELCPLVPVPKHGRLIDADALCKTLRNLAENEYTPTVFANWIEHHIDTIIPAEEGET